MDTIEEPMEPAGSDDVTSSPDTSLADTQPSETSENVDGGTEVEGGASETLLAGKYKSPEDLEKAYKELETKLGGLGQKAAVADLIQEKYGMTPDQLRQTIEAQEQAQMEQQYRDNPGAFAVQKVQALEAKLALQEEERELDSFLQKNPEYAHQRDKILKLGLNLEKDKPYEDIAREYFGETRAQGQQDAYKKIDAKVRTQATGTQSAPQKKFTEADMENMSTKELEAILPWADVSHRPY
jgi:hypothetical protein